MSEQIRESYACDFCSAPALLSCFACGKKFCGEHGRIPNVTEEMVAGIGPAENIPGTSPVCGECYYLKLYGDTYQLCIAGNYVVEDIGSVNDVELGKMLEAYDRKVKELETLIASAKRQQALMRNRLKLTRVGPKGVKAPKAEAKPDLEELAKQLLEKGLSVDEILAKLQGDLEGK